MKRSSYRVTDFDFVLVIVEELSICYVFPVEVFISYGGQIQFVESVKRQRKPKSFVYRERWELILEWAAQKGISV